MNHRRGIDIIIPVYNALSDLKLCVDSITRHTDLTVDRVLLIDDKSPDQNVFPYMQSIEQPGIVVLRNEENQGFSGTINRGLLYSDRDVILLNSDTVVTAGWVDKITACADSDPAIGTVTPFSNNATLCSIPNFCEENTIPYGLSIDEYAAVIERCSMKKYPRITVAVGFCMFIKREVITATGLFDKETFARGYGEENDFCWRAEQLGYRHVLCDDTYIYHSGSSSFLSSEKRQLIAEHEAIIEKWYPQQNQKNREYVRDNPDQYLRTNVDIHAKLHNGKKNLLYVLHMDFRADSVDNIGGTQFHVKDLVAHMRKDHNVFVLARDGRMLRLTVYLERDQMTFSFPIGEKPAFMPFTHKAIAETYRLILKAFSVDMVHVHHVSGLSFDFFSITKEMGIPMAMTLHDFYFVCPTIKLLERKTSYCGGCGENCDACLRDELGYVPQTHYLQTWRAHCRSALECCDAVITPSEAVKKVYCSIYPEIESKVRVVYHGMDSFAEETVSFGKADQTGFCRYVEYALEKDNCISGWAYREGVSSKQSEIFVCLEDGQGNRGCYASVVTPRADVIQGHSDDRYLYSGFSIRVPDNCFETGPLKMQIVIKNKDQLYYGPEETVTGYVKREKNKPRIAFLGGLNETKGSATAYQMIKQAGNSYEWYIIGGLGDPNLMALEKGNVHKSGWYKRENVRAILQQNRIDLVCILPICPETFCYTLSEAQLAGVPVLATDIGALGERLRKDGTGWLVAPETDAAGMLAKIREIFRDADGYALAKERTEQFGHKSIGQMCSEYGDLYRTLFPASRRAQQAFDAQAVYNAYALCQMDAIGGDSTDLELIRRVTELENSMRIITQSLEYKMVKFFNREDLPFKKPFQWLISVAYRIYVKIKYRK